MTSIEQEFLKKGYVTFSVEKIATLKNVQEMIATEISASGKNTLGKNLDEIHACISVSEINDLRIKIYNLINQQPGFTKKYFKLFEKQLSKLIGNELACQNKVNVSIQMPGDTTSTLALHTDTVAGQSKFEVVAWLPLTAAFETNAMYVFSIEDSQDMLMELPQYQEKGMNALFNDWQHKASFIEVKEGEALIFSSNLMHGNVVNKTSRTRISLNSRYKGLFTPYNDYPYSEKKLGGFYMPMSLSPVTELAIKIKEPFGKF